MCFGRTGRLLMPNKPETAGDRTPRECDCRRADFLGGQPIRLADGQEWSFPDPHCVASAGQALLSDILDLLDTIAGSEDSAEECRGELCLAIRLLATNYDLTPDEYQRLLICEPGDPSLAQMQSGFRSLARLHAEVLWSRRTRSASIRDLDFTPPRPAHDPTVALPLVPRAAV